MIVAMDASVLIHVFQEDARGPVGVDRPRERVDHLIAKLQIQRAVIVIPTPSLAEALVKSGTAGLAILQRLERSRTFRFADFDTRAAVEHAALAEQRLAVNPRLSRDERAKAKFDEQIVAIAAVERATVIYADDADIKRLADWRFEVIGLAELPLPPSADQGELFSGTT